MTKQQKLKILKDRIDILLGTFQELDSTESLTPYGIVDFHTTKGLKNSLSLLETYQIKEVKSEHLEYIKRYIDAIEEDYSNGYYNK